MLTITDIAVSVLLLCFLISGWNKGIVKAVIGPLATLLCIAAVYTFFNKIQNPFLCLLILILGPIVLSILLSMLLSYWHKAVTYKEPPLLLSRLLGGAFNALWGWGMMIFVLVFFGIMPPRVFKFKQLQKDILASYSYAYVHQSLIHKMPQIKSTANLLEVFEDPQKIGSIQNTPGYEEIYNHKKIQALLADEKVVALIKEKAVAKLLVHPKVMAIWQDSELMKKFLEVSQKSMLLQYRKEPPGNIDKFNP